MAEDVTQFLLDLEDGRHEAFDRLLQRVYPDLREIAHPRLRNQRADHTLDTTDLVHEAYLRLVRYQEVSWKGRAHFFGAAAQTMRRILIDHARAKRAQKRRGKRVSLTQVGEAASDVSLDRLIAPGRRRASPLGAGRGVPLLCRVDYRRDGGSARHLARPHTTLQSGTYSRGGTIEVSAGRNLPCGTSCLQKASPPPSRCRIAGWMFSQAR